MATAAGFAGPIRARPTAVGLEIWPARPPGGGTPPWLEHVARGCGNVFHGQNPFGLKTGRNDPIRGPQVLGNFSKVLELKMSVLGLGFYLVWKTRFI